ncbi:MAG: hypothetical protein J6Y62_05875 [Clostridia bacterium]|nr:hypothetical protein [Clostridia bacterium]
MKDLLENLVPPLASCQRIRPEWLEGCMFCWKEDVDYTTGKKTFKVEQNYKWDPAKKVPAPTAEELAAAIGQPASVEFLPNGMIAGRTGNIEVSVAGNAAEALLELLIAVKGKKA